MSHKKYFRVLKFSLLILIVPTLACQAVTQSIATPTATTPTSLPTFTLPPPTPDSSAQRQEYLDAFSDVFTTWFDSWTAWTEVHAHAVDTPNAELAEDEEFKSQLAQALTDLDLVVLKIEQLPEPTQGLEALDGYMDEVAVQTQILSDHYLDAITGDDEAGDIFLEALDKLSTAVQNVNEEAERLRSSP
jgi:hypothetical protein